MLHSVTHSSSHTNTHLGITKNTQQDKSLKPGIALRIFPHRLDCYRLGPCPIHICTKQAHSRCSRRPPLSQVSVPKQKFSYHH